MNERWAIKVCPDCGEQAFGGGLCRQHYPPGHPVETMVARVEELIVLRSDLRVAVSAGDAFKAAVIDALRMSHAEHVLRDRLWGAVEDYQAATGDEASNAA